jgi:hypothetical protein
MNAFATSSEAERFLRGDEMTWSRVMLLTFLSLSSVADVLCSLSAQTKKLIVVIHHALQSSEAAIVIRRIIYST